MNRFLLDLKAGAALNNAKIESAATTPIKVESKFEGKYVMVFKTTLSEDEKEMLGLDPADQSTRTVGAVHNGVIYFRNISSIMCYVANKDGQTASKLLLSKVSQCPSNFKNLVTIGQFSNLQTNNDTFQMFEDESISCKIIIILLFNCVD